MSDVPTDPTQAAGGQEPSEEEIRAYLSQLRSTPVDQVLAEVASALVNAAQVKLGRQDARLLLDVVAAVSQTVRGEVADELPDQLDDVLAKLRMAQVEGEKEVATAAEQGHAEPSDLGSEATEAPSTPPSAPGQAPAGGEAPAGGQPSPGSRLWTPGG